MSAMTPLFGDQPKNRWNWVEITIRAVSINLAGAFISSILALWYFAVAFAAGEASLATGEANRTLPAGVIVILAVTVVAVTSVGAVLAFLAKHFPWLAVTLIPLFLGLVFRTYGVDFTDGLALGGICSAVYLAGAVIGRIAKNRMRMSMRKRVGTAAQTG